MSRTGFQPAGVMAVERPSKPLPEQIAEALHDGAVPISRLLRLIWALDAEPSPDNENLRVQLRARIGAPPSL